MSHGTDMNESRHKHIWVTAQTWMSHGTNTNESRHRHEWDTAQTQMSHVTDMNESRHKHKWVTSQTWMSHGTNTNESRHRHEGRHTQAEAIMCCSVLQCVAVCCSVLQCVAVCCTQADAIMRRVAAPTFYSASAQMWIVCDCVCDCVWHVCDCVWRVCDCLYQHSTRHVTHNVSLCVKCMWLCVACMWLCVSTFYAVSHQMRQTQLFSTPNVANTALSNTKWVTSHTRTGGWYNAPCGRTNILQTETWTDPYARENVLHTDVLPSKVWHTPCPPPRPSPHLLAILSPCQSWCWRVITLKLQVSFGVWLY